MNSIESMFVTIVRREEKVLARRSSTAIVKKFSDRKKSNSTRVTGSAFGYNFATACSTRNHNGRATRPRKKFDDIIFIRFDTISACDRAEHRAGKKKRKQYIRLHTITHTWKHMIATLGSNMYSSWISSTLLWRRQGEANRVNGNMQKKTAGKWQRYSVWKWHVGLYDTLCLSASDFMANKCVH